MFTLNFINFSAMIRKSNQKPLNRYITFVLLTDTLLSRKHYLKVSVFGMSRTKKARTGKSYSAYPRSRERYTDVE